MATEIGLIAICNTTGSAANASLYHDDDGTTYDQTTALMYAQPIPANSTVWVKAEAFGFITIKRGGAIGIQSGTASALTFTAYGITESIAQ